jgi:hypothetical protein
MAPTRGTGAEGIWRDRFEGMLYQGKRVDSSLETLIVILRERRDAQSLYHQLQRRHERCGSQEAPVLLAECSAETTFRLAGAFVESP